MKKNKPKDKRVKIDASFEELVKESVSDNPKPELKIKQAIKEAEGRLIASRTKPEPKEKISPDKKIKALEIIHKHLLNKGKKN